MKTNDSHAGFGSGSRKIEVEKDLFIPLKREYYEAFERGDKDTEYRLPGGPWNERTCYPGRMATLSMGYGKARRMRKKIISFGVHALSAEKWEAFKACYPGKPNLAACIRFEVIL